VTHISDSDALLHIAPMRARKASEGKCVTVRHCGTSRAPIVAATFGRRHDALPPPKKLAFALNHWQPSPA